MKGRSVPIGQARPRLTEILEIAQREPVTITKDGVPAAVVVSPEDYESLIATIELLQSPEARERLREFEEQTKQGLLEFVSGEEAERRLLALGQMESQRTRLCPRAKCQESEANRECSTALARVPASWYGAARSI